MKSREEASFREHSETHYWRDRAREAEKDRDRWREEAIAVATSDLMKAHDALSKEWAKEKKRADEAEERAKKAEAERDAAIADLETAMRFEVLDRSGLFNFLCGICKVKECDGVCEPQWRGRKEE